VGLNIPPWFSQVLAISNLKLSNMKNQCEKEIIKTNKILAKKYKKNKNKLNPCKGQANSCSCSDSTSNMVDLVLLIDSSTTMESKARIVNSAATAGLQSAKKKCRANIRTVWLWVDKEESGSSSSHGLGGAAGNFTHSHQVYLENLGITGPFYHDQIDSIESPWQPYEKGAAAISDISEYFDWRPNACRSILYISDTKLAGYDSTEIDNDIAVNQAITVANSNNVTIFAHRADNPTFIPPMSITQVDDDYLNLCSSTGGHAETGGISSINLYTSLIEKAVCNCKKKCVDIKKPDVKPCISISWGKTKCDGLESSDCQTFCIKICNCYSNVTFCDLTISQIIVTKPNGHQVPVLPNGDPVINPIPLGPICFGNIEPCTRGKATCVSRQFMIKTNGAKPGNYQIHFNGLCFGVKFDYNQDLCYNLEIC